MENYSTPIENIMHKDDTDNDTDNSNLTTAAKVLQKYNELENNQQYNQPDNQQDNQPDEQYNRDQINNETVQHQFESSYVNDHRMNELNRINQYQQQQQHQQQPPQQYYQNPALNKPVQNKGMMSKFKNIANSIFNNLIITLVVVGLFILFNLKAVDTTLVKFLPSLANSYGAVNFKGVLFKGLLVGIIFLIIKYFM